MPTLREKGLFRRDLPRFLFFAAALILRALSAGGTYLPVMDDSIQYVNYPTSLSYWRLILENGLFDSRPLAIVTDLFFVGPFSDCLIVPVLMLAVLYAAAGVIFQRLFEREFQCGAAFTVLFCLLPLGVEGTHWLSAASRIVPGLFFCALAARCYASYIRRGGWWRCGAYALCALLSYGFYEQILVLSLTMTLLRMSTSLRRTRRAWAGLWGILGVGIYFGFTSAFSALSQAGALGARMEIVLPFSPWYYDTFLSDLARQIGAAFIKGGCRTLFVGFWRGLTESVSVFSVIFSVLALVGGAVLWFFLRPRGNIRVTPLGRWGMALLWGFLLFLAPIAPFFVIARPYFCLRATVPCFVGAGILIDLLLRTLLRRRQAYGIFCGLALCVCLIGGASEVRDYRAVGEADQKLAEQILSHMEEMEGRVGLLGVEEYATPGQNYRFNGHIASVGQADWCLYGKLVALAGEELKTAPVPLWTESEPFYGGWNTEMKRLSGFDQIWLWESGTLIPLQMEHIEGGTPHDYRLYYPGGALWGTVRETDGIGYVQTAESG